MPKKPPKNGYYFFMLNFKRRAENRGRHFPGGMQEVAKAASEEWKSLPEFRRDHFNKLAKERRNDPRPNISKHDDKRFNSQGISFAEIKMTKTREEERLRQQTEFITQFVNQMNLSDLRDKLMYLIHVNIFCKTDNERYYPAEIGLVKFSLRGGIKRIFHRYIDPGEVALGYSYAMKEHSERTHKLTLQFVRSVDGTSDFPRLYKEICQFLSEDEEEGIIPPLFTMYDNVFFNSSLNAVRGALKSLWFHMHPSHDSDDDSWEREFRVLPLPDMFCLLKNRCMAVTNPNTVAFPNQVLALSELKNDTYHYELDSACKFHRDEDIILHCSKSFVLRWVYIIRDHCADLIGVDMFPKYVPPKVEVKEEKDDEFYDNESMTESKYSYSQSEASVDLPKYRKAVPKYWKAEENSSVASSDDFPKLVKAEVSCGWPSSSSTASLQSRFKEEKYDSSCSASTRPLKRERVGDEGAAGDYPQKREKNEDGYPAPGASRQSSACKIEKSEKDDWRSVSVKTEKDSPARSVAGFIKSENDGTLVGVVKQENYPNSNCAMGRIKDEKDVKSVDLVAGSVKEEKNIDGLKEEKSDVFVKEEKNTEIIKTEKNADLMKKEGDIKEDKEEKETLFKEEKIDPGYDW